MENRKLDHKDRTVTVQNDWPFASAVYYKEVKWPIYFLRDETGNFVEFNSGYKDWYIQVAIEKLLKIKEQTQLINDALILRYRWAIREGYNHQLDSALLNAYDYPRNQNTIKGVESYIKRIQKASEKEMEQYQ
jgi:hypothetical protein